jgi:hypothetical protein
MNLLATRSFPTAPLLACLLPGLFLTACDRPAANASSPANAIETAAAPASSPAPASPALPPGRLSDKAAAAPVQFDITYTEPAGIARSRELMIYKLHVPEGALPAERLEHLAMFRLVDGAEADEIACDFDRSRIYHHHRDGSVRQLTLFWQDALAPSESRSYRVKLADQPAQRLPRPSVEIERDGYQITMQLGKDSYRLDHLPVLDAAGNPAALADGTWSALVLERIDPTVAKPSRFTILNAVRADDGLLGKSVIHFGKPRVEVRDNGIRTMIELFYEGSGMAVDPRGRSVLNLPGSRSYVKVEFRRDDPVVRIYSNRSFAKQNIQLDGRHLYGAVTVPVERPEDLEIASARGAGLLAKSIFVSKDPSQASDEPVPADWQDLDALLLNGGTPATGKLNSDHKDALVDFHVVAEKGKRCNFWYAAHDGYGVPAAPDRGQVGHAKVRIGGQPGYGLFLLDACLESETNATEPYVYFEVMLDQPYENDHLLFTELARRIASPPIAVYDRRNTAFEPPAPKQRRHPWKPAAVIDLANAPVTLEIENPGDQSLVNEVIEIEIRRAGGEQSAADSSAPYVADANGAELPADLRRGDWLPDGQPHTGRAILVVQLVQLAPGATRITIDPSRKATPLPPMEFVDNFPDAWFQPDPQGGTVPGGMGGMPQPKILTNKFTIGNGVRKYDLGFGREFMTGDTEKGICSSLFVKALDTPDGFSGVTTIGRMYGCVHQPMDEGTPYLNYGHQIIFPGDPTSLKIERNGLFVEIESVHNSAMVYQGDSEGVARLMDYDNMTFESRVRIMRGRDVVESWSHRHVKHGIYNHNGYRLNALIFNATDAGVKIDTELDPAFNRPDPLNDRLWLVGMDNTKPVHTTGTQTILFKNRDGEWEIQDSSNWRGNSPFVPVTRGRENHGFHLVSGLTNGPNFRRGVYFYSPDYADHVLPDFYRDDWGYECPFSCVFNGRASGSSAFSVAQNSVQTGWGMGWIASYMPGGNYDDHSRLHLDATYDEAKLEAYRKLTATLREGIRVRAM